MSALLTEREPILDEFRWLRERSAAPRLRTMREWAEDEIILPNGPFAGQRFRGEFQPWSIHWLDAIDSGVWNTFSLCAPGQSGKSLMGFVLIALYHLFEIGETVILAVPDLNMIRDKWEEDVEPVFSKTRYRDLMPSGGLGSRGGTPLRLQFRNGATLRFMSFGGRDKAKAGFTSRVVIFTEVDGAKGAAESVEAGPIKQIEARTNAYGSRRRIYKECTASVAEGHIWQEVTGGTNSHLACLCPHCRRLVLPSRDNLVGWKECERDFEVVDSAAWSCPTCSALWSESDRLAANANSLRIDKGRRVSDDGKRIIGDAEKTLKFGLHPTAVNNMFRDAGDVGLQEWNALRATNREESERELLQFTHALPAESSSVALRSIDAISISRRFDDSCPDRGVVPADTERLVFAADVHYALSWWALLAERRNGSIHICDYGKFDFPGNPMSYEDSVATGLRDMAAQMIDPGWKVEGTEALIWPRYYLFDSGWQMYEVYKFCREKGNGWLPVKGFSSIAKTNGKSEQIRVRRGVSAYLAPREKRKDDLLIGAHFHVSYQPEHQVPLLNVNADEFKSAVHAGISQEMRLHDPRSISLFRPDNETDHYLLAQAYLSEGAQEVWVEGSGYVLTWVVKHRSKNHLLDVTGYCLCGLRMLAMMDAQAQADRVGEIQVSSGLTTPDGRPFNILDRG